MKKFFISMMGLLVMLSCGQKPQSSSDTDDEDEREELKLKTYTFSDSKGMAHVDVSIDYPIKGETELVDAIRLYIADVVGLESDEVELDDAQGVTDFFGRQLMEYMESLAEGFEGDDYVTEVYHNWTFSKLYEADDFVTFLGETELYEGGIHGIDYQQGVTFFENGQRFTSNMLRNTDSEDFQKLIRKGLKVYFSEDPDNMTDEELAEELITVEAIDMIPMPSAEPYITKDGVTFLYQPYEISYYAAGMPMFCVPLEKMRPFLNKKAIKLLDLDDDD